MRDPSDTAMEDRAFSKTIGKKEQGLNLVITILSWPTQHLVQTVTGAPKNEVTRPLEMSDACRKPYKKEEMQHSSQQQPSLKGSFSTRGQNGIEGEIYGEPLFPPQNTSPKSLCMPGSWLAGRRTKINIMFSQLLGFKFLTPQK